MSIQRPGIDRSHYIYVIYLYLINNRIKSYIADHSLKQERLLSVPFPRSQLPGERQVLCPQPGLLADPYINQPLTVYVANSKISHSAAPPLPLGGSGHLISATSGNQANHRLDYFSGIHIISKSGSPAVLYQSRTRWRPPQRRLRYSPS